MHDLLIGAPDFSAGGGSSWGVMDWYSLRDGSFVTRVQPPGQTPGAGFYGPSLGRPRPGDRFAVMACPEPLWGNSRYLSYIGRVHLLRAAPTGVLPLGASCSGTLGSAPAMGFSLHNGGRVHLTGAPAGATALLLVGASSQTWAGSALPLALDPYGFPGCSLSTSIDALVATSAGQVGVGAGYAYLDVPRLPVPLFGQWWVIGSGPTWPGGLSSGLQW